MSGGVSAILGTLGDCDADLCVVRPRGVRGLRRTLAIPLAPAFPLVLAAVAAPSRP